MSRLTQDEIVQELNRIFAEEIEAATRYLHLASCVKGMDRLLVQDVLREGVRETIQHAEVIAQKIRSLGAVPRLDINVSCPPEPMSARDALRQALTFEEAALECYQDLLRKVDGDVALEEFVRSQIAEESEHIAQLRDFLAE